MSHEAKRRRLDALGVECARNGSLVGWSVVRAEHEMGQWAEVAAGARVCWADSKRERVRRPNLAHALSS